MKVSQDSLVFSSPDERTKTLQLTNNHETSVYIYKIKTNNLQAFEATPNYGFIRAKTSLSLYITTTAYDPFQAKLQIAYAEIGEKTTPDFTVEWANLQSSQMKKEQIQVSRISELKQSSKIKSSISNESKKHKQSENEREPDLLKFESIKSINNFDLQQKLVEQQLANTKMRQQIQITQEKLRQINQERLQIKVNKSIGIICEEHHTSFTTLLLYGLAIFVLGYALAKSQ